MAPEEQDALPGASRLAAFTDAEIGWLRSGVAIDNACREDSAALRDELTAEWTRRGFDPDVYWAD